MRLKLLGQVVGLVWATVAASKGNPAAVFEGVSGVMAANVGFWLAGAGGARHDDDGNPAPVPAKLVRTIGAVDALLLGVALFGAREAARLGSAPVCSLVLAAGCGLGIVENLPKRFKELAGK